MCQCDFLTKTSSSAFPVEVGTHMDSLLTKGYLIACIILLSFPISRNRSVSVNDTSIYGRPHKLLRLLSTSLESVDLTFSSGNIARLALGLLSKSRWHPEDKSAVTITSVGSEFEPTRFGEKPTIDSRYPCRRSPPRGHEYHLCLDMRF